MGCCHSGRIIKHSKNVYEFIDSLEYNIYLLNDELKKLSAKSKEIYNLGKRVLKLNDEILEVLRKIETYDLITTNWESMRDASDVCFNYYYTVYSSLNSVPSKEEEDAERKFLIAEKELKSMKKEIIVMIKNK